MDKDIRLILFNQTAIMEALLAIKETLGLRGTADLTQQIADTDNRLTERDTREFK